MFTFKPEHRDTQIVLRKHGIVVEANTLTNAIGQLIVDEYPQYSHLIMEVDPKTKRADNPLTISVPELEKKKDILLTSTVPPIDGIPSNLNEEKQESALTESQPLKRKAGRPRKDSSQQK